ncbi:MAG: hypothetical protein Q8O27_00350 [Enterobacteriaceae bacterium]|nr:hypothetical protein [Enterobacteriaceae bacterium]
MKKIKVFTLIVFALFLSGCTAEDATLNKNINKPVANENKNINYSVSNNNANNQPAPTIKYSYKIKESADSKKETLVKINDNTGEETVLVEDMYKKYSLFFNLIAELPEQNLIILQTIAIDSDKAAGVIYKLSLNSLALTRLNINNVLVGEDNFGIKKIAPNGPKVAMISMPIGQGIATKLYIGDVISDTSSVLVQLKEGENFSKNTIGGMSTEFNIKWTDNNTIEYAVYKTTKQYNNDLIEYRKVNIK